MCQRLCADLLPMGLNARQDLWRINFTGMTPAAINFNFHKEQLELLQALPETICNQVSAELDRRAIGGGNLTMEMIKNEIVGPIQKRLDSMRLPTSITKPTSDDDADALLRLGEVGTARFRNLPKDYILNSKLLSTLAAWTCWHLGEERKAQNVNSESTVLFVTPP